MTLRDLIVTLDSIELTDSKDCEDSVSFIIGLILSELPWLHHPLPAGTIISRCRRGFVPLIEKSFKCRDASNVTGFQRASIPFETVFYGAVGDSSIEEGDFIAMLETSELHRKGLNHKKEKISVSHWEVKQDIDMAIICHPNVFVNTDPSGAVKNMQENYKRRLPDYPNHILIPDFDRLVEFVSEQFAKTVNDGDNHEYMISAYFAHNLWETESGIIYPSVQANGRLGFNVAIRPDIVESSLSFVGAEKHILFKAKDYLQLPANYNDFYTDEQLAEVLGIKSIDELNWIE
jgi:hypothetical protein